MLQTKQIRIEERVEEEWKRNEENVEDIKS